MKKHLLLLFLNLLPMVARAYDIAVKNDDGVMIYYNYYNEGKELEVTKNGSKSYCCSVVIPEEVTYMNRNRKVTSIGSYAFQGCNGLISISFPNSVVSIGEGAFWGCTGLTSITIPNSVTSIGHFAFRDCSSLSSITIPNSVTCIGSNPFGGCSVLISINMEEGNTIYDSRDNCNAIIETTTNTLIVGCKKTAIPKSVTSIGEGAFFRCSGLTSITIPNSVTSIDNSVFAGCTGLTSITIPNSVTSIGHYAFGICTGLTSITIPNSVTSIGVEAFCGCTGLTSITIPNSVTSIGERAFRECVLSEVISKIENPFIINTNTFTDNTFYNATLYVPAGTIEKYKSIVGWKKFEFIEECPSSGISNLESEGTIVQKRYTLDGKVTRDSHKGMNIIQMNNGETKKVIAK